MRRNVMKNKKIIYIFTIALIVILIAGYFGIRYAKEKEKEKNNFEEEFIPEEEITEEQARQTIVSLYFQNKDTEELMPEARLVDIKDIMSNPYEKLVYLLIEGPKSDKAVKVIPENTKVLKTYMEGDCVILDLSSEFLNYSKDNQKQKKNMVNSIVNTLTELTEVNSVKFMIDGQVNEEFKDVYVREKQNEKQNEKQDRKQDGR